MKKSSILLLTAGIAAFVACGPSAEEKAKMEQAHQDSIAMEQTRIQDSITAVETAAKAEADRMAAAMADSLKMVAVQDSMAKMKAVVKPKSKPKSDPAPKKPEDVKPGQGRG